MYIYTSVDVFVFEEWQIKEWDWGGLSHPRDDDLELDKIMILKFAAVIAAGFFSLTAFAAGLFAGQGLFQGQAIVSDANNYKLVMQTDGNLVFYRNSDNAVRFATMAFGNYTVMQNDGNLVEYGYSGGAIWHANTAGNAGAFLAVQDDGNLVVYSASGQPLWNIGADQGPVDGPTNAADVVARDLNVPGFGALGHVGIWTGDQVIEVVNQKVNAVRYSSWDSFRNASPVWATAHPNIPNHKIYYCFNSNFCNYAPTAGVAARTAIIQRANQIRLLGADYTATSSWRWALVAEPGQPAQRGIYRCDTFVADSFWHSAGYNWGYYVPSAWSTRMNDLLYSTNILPTYVWNKLKN